MKLLYKKWGRGTIISSSLLFISLLFTMAMAGESMKIGEIGVESDITGLKRVTQHLVAPPFLPVHEQIAMGSPKIVAMTMKIVEKEIEIAEDVFVQAMTFEGSNPGPIIIVHENDYVELTLQNPNTNSMVHNIDLHAATGALGGAQLTEVAPGQEAVLRFKASKSGVFVYHCAPGGLMIPFHVVSGMNGVIMVLPRNGLTDETGNKVSYDKGYYIGEQDWYVPQDNDGEFKRYTSPAAAMGDTFKVMKTLIPTHLTFNGKVGAITGENAMKAKVGETVLFIHSQANRDSRVHLIGGHGDLVWRGGSFNDAPATNLQSWSVVGGEAAAALYTFKQPGIYAYVNHNLIESIMLGAAAHVLVQGLWNNDLMEQVQKPSIIASQH
jgi:nitrite reductase (NO-forming)